MTASKPEDLRSIRSSPANTMYKVHIIESERGWGQRIDEIKEFKTLAAAEKFVEEFNKKNNKDTVPDWYMYAQLAP